jgi:N-hydroxyarylamine O-acetyltransferase
MPRERAASQTSEPPGPVPAGGVRLVAAYLRRLGVDHPGEPSLAALRALHRAHVERVPYEVLDIQLGRLTTVDPRDCAARVLRRRGGYCVQLNGAFSTLLAGLGYDVRWHRAGVHANPATPPVSPAAPAPHLALTVRLDGQEWFVDVGLGDGLYEPLPLRTGSYQQGPFTFSLAPSAVEPGGWRFDRATRGSIAGLDIATATAGTADFAEWHPYLATSPESRLVRAVAVMRRDATGADGLMGCLLRRVDAGGRTERELSTMADWYGVLVDLFGLDVSDVEPERRAALWRRVREAHERWLGARAAK